MKTIIEGYVSPTIEIMEILLESGFAASGTNENLGYEDGEW